MSALDRRFEVAQAVAAQAGAMALSMQQPPGASTGSLKGVQDWLTEADGAVERYLSGVMADSFPHDGFQGEEEGTARQGALRWVVDPIDGTSNYARGGTRWCVSLGLLEGRQPLLGVLVAPGLGETYAACAGQGATLNGTRIHASTTAELSRGIVECGWSRRRPTAEYHALCTRVMATGAMLRAGGSGAMGLADVASGRLDGYIEMHINLWDVAAGLAILTEAGAVLNGFMDGPGPTEGAPIFAAAPGVAAALEMAAALG